MQNAAPIPPAELGMVGIVGLGLMGGSLGLALRRRRLATQVIGCGRPALVTRAIEMGAIDSGTQDVLALAKECDVIFLCTPVETSIGLLRQIALVLKPAALITDVGSTKQSFAEAARDVFGAAAAERVLPGHPMAGSEKSGLENAVESLYEDCLWLLTPLGHRTTPLQDALRRALKGVGARLAEVSPAEHDRTLAYTSHLPQMLSSVLAMTLEAHFGSPENPALQLHAGGLNSMLRLAVSDPAMWEQIALSNPRNISSALERFEAELRHLRLCLEDGEFRRRFEAARDFALALRNRK